MKKSKIFSFLFLYAFLSITFLAAEEEKYTIEIHNAPLKNVIRFLVKLDNKSVVIPKNKKLDASVTASFVGSYPFFALEAILTSNDLASLEQRDFVQIVEKDEIEALGKDLLSHTILLQYSDAKTLSKEFTSLLTPRGKILANKRTNSLIIRDRSEVVEKITNLIEENTSLSKVIHLRYPSIITTNQIQAKLRLIYLPTLFRAQCILSNHP